MFWATSLLLQFHYGFLQDAITAPPYATYFLVVLRRHASRFAQQYRRSRLARELPRQIVKIGSKSGFRVGDLFRFFDQRQQILFY